MSKTVDERVVEMRFDNNQFEKNIQTSMLTLQKLKQSLNLTGASKGLENLNSAAKNVDLSGLSGAVETVCSRFSALEVMGVTALANITNSAVNAGKRMIKALTLDPVTTGFQEYETQINAVQTILANTQSKGTTLDDVNMALDELNRYADKTIYNFTEMTRNIGTFTAAGVDLDKSVTSIKGIANLAAVSGSTSQQASTAMYQLSQALAAGKVSLMDWNSVVNAGMGGEVFQTALKRTATQMGYNVDAIIKHYGSFRESLTEGEWLTTEVLTETLTQLSGAYTEADLIAQGYTKKQAKEITELAKTAVGAATEVKTFTQLWDTLKEAAQSGWTQTWELLIGDFEQAKSLLTGISDTLGGFINKISDARNNLLKGALGSKWEQLEEKINAAGISTDDFQKKLSETMKEHGMSLEGVIRRYGSLGAAITSGAVGSDKIIETLKKFAGAGSDASKSTADMTDKLEYFQKVVNDVWRGDYKNGEERVKALTDAGYDYATVQNLVNKTVDGHKLTLEDLSDAQLKNVGYTDKEIKKIRELAKEAEKTGTPLNELIMDISKPTGRELLIDTFKNALQPLGKIITAVGTAWKSAFPPMTSNQLYNIIEALNSFSKHLVMSDETSGKLTRTLKGVFAILGMITDIAGGAFKIAFKLVNAVLGYFNMDILSVTALIGDAIVAFRKATDISILFSKAIEKGAPYIIKFVKEIRELITEFLKLPQVQNIVDKFKSKMSDFKGIGKNVIEGLKEGLKEGITAIPGILIDLARRMIEAIRDVLGIESPSTEMREVGTYVIEGLIEGIQNGISMVLKILKKLGLSMIETFNDIDMSKIFAGGISIGLLLLIKKITDALGTLAAPLEGLGGLFSGAGKVMDESAKGVGKVLKSFSKVLNGFAFSIKAKALKNIAISLAILAGSIFLLSFIPTDKLWITVLAVGALAGILVALSFAMDMISKATGGVNVGKLSLGLMGIAAALLILGFTVKLIGSMKIEQAIQGFAGLIVLINVIGAVVLAYGLLVKDEQAENIDKLGSMLMKMSIAMLLMIGVVKLIGKLSPTEMAKGGIFAVCFAAFVAVLALITKLAGNNTDKLGGMLIKMTIAMGLMVGVVKLISKLSTEEMIKGGIFALGFVVFVGLLAFITNLARPVMPKLGGMLISMTIAMGLMVGVVKLIGKLTPAEMVKGGIAIAAFAAIIYGLLFMVERIGPDAPKLAATILAFSAAIAILAGVAVILSLIDPTGLAKGIAAVVVLSVFMALMIAATKNANDCKNNLIVMTVAIAVMAVAVAALSMIDGTKLFGATLAMSVLMGMFALMTKAASSATNAMGTLIVMTAVVALLGGILYLLSGLPVESVLTVALSLSTLLLALSASMFIISKLGTVSPMALISVVVMTAVVGALAGILWLVRDLPVESTLGIAQSLSLLLLALSGALVILGVVGLMSVAVLPGITALVTLIVVMGAVITAIGALVTKVPKLEEFLNTGIPILEKIGYALGSFLGNIVGGFVGNVTSGLPAMANDLSLFMENLQPFITYAKAIDPAMMEGVRALAETILILTAADVLEGLTSWLTGGSSIADFGAQLGGLGTSLNEFATNLGTFDESKVTTITCAANALKTLAQAAATIPNEGGLWAKIAGDNSLAAFGAQLGALGTNLNNFTGNLGTFDDAKVATVNAASNALKTLAGAAKEIPNEGGLWASIVGDNSLASFGVSLVDLGTNLAQFATNLGTFDEAKVATVTCAANAIKLMAAAAKDIPNEGGFWAKIVGENSIAAFGDKLPALGTHLRMFTTNLGTFDGAKIQTVTCASNAIKSLAEAAKTIPNEGGFWAKIAGDNSIATFGNKLPGLGTNLKEFADNAGDVSVEKVNKAVRALNAIVNLAKLDVESAGSNLKSFGKNIVSFAKKVSEFGTKMGKISGDSITSAIDKTKELISFAKTVAGTNIESLKTFGTSLKSIGTDGVKGFIGAFTKISVKSDMKKAASGLADKLIEGLKSKRTKIETEGDNLADAALKKIKTSSNYEAFKSAGSYLVSGLVAGISANKYKATKKGKELANAIEQAVKNELGIKSPSRVFYEIGDYTGQGFVNALSDYASISYKTASEMCDSARKGLSSAINKIKNSIDSDMDTQPTIRPVVDLSDVKSSAGAINSMFGVGTSVDVLANLGAISYAMNRNSQNGGNSEIVSAINKLRKDLGNIGGTTYNIDGVTYDDGSNISEAVRSLVRAAKVERRI